ncbi:MAG: DUF6049 family protein [Bifidobacteriaceae bacterium]|jgi:hypothetical protein|nr:DUF6049 family protein [Bifidobacteriaceae bacterium]
MRSLRGGLGAAVVAAGLALAPASAGAGPTPATVAAASDKVEAPTVTITGATPVLTGPDETLSVTVRVSNATAKAWRGDIKLMVASEPFKDRPALAAWADLGLVAADEASWPVTALGGERLEPGQTETYTITAAASTLDIGDDGDEPGWGPRGLQVTLETTRGTVAAARTYLVYAPPEATAGQLNLSVAAGLTAAPGETREQALERVTKVAAATADSWMAWLVDPSLLVAGAAAQDARAQALADAITEAVGQGKAIYLLPYQDIDEVALRAGGSGGKALALAVRKIGQAALAEAVGEVAATRVATNLGWAVEPIDGAVASYLAAVGSEAILLAPGQFDQPAAAAVTKQAGQPALIATDEGLGEALAGERQPLGINRLMAETALMAQRAQVEGRTASAVVSMARDWAADQSGWSLLDSLTGQSWIKATSLSAAINEPAGEAVDLTAAGGQDGSASALGLDTLTELVGVTDRMAAFASLTPDPDAYMERSLPPLLTPLSNAVAPAARAEAARVALTNAATAVPPVSVVAGSEVNLISDDGRVPVVVQNGSNEPITGLVVDLKAQTNAIRVGEPVILDLAPGQSATARVPVHAVANGVFRVKVDLLDASGRPVAEGASLTMRVQAEWENVGTAIIGGVLGLVLALGVFTTVRKRRAQARAGDGAGDGAGADTGADAGGGARAEAGAEARDQAAADG